MRSTTTNNGIATRRLASVVAVLASGALASSCGGGGHEPLRLSSFHGVSDDSPTSCEMVATDSDISTTALVEASSPFPQVTDLGVEYAVSDQSGIIDYGYAYVPAAAPHERFRVASNDRTMLDGRDLKDLTCQVLGVGRWPY